jgi:hypothetical protein
MKRRQGKSTLLLVDGEVTARHIYKSINKAKRANRGNMEANVARGEKLKFAVDAVQVEMT